MAYNTQTYITGQLIDSVDMNQLRDNMNTLAMHNHGSGLGSGHGTSVIGPIASLVSGTLGSPTAPAAGVTVVWVSGTVTFSAPAWRRSDGSVYAIQNWPHSHPAQ